MQRFDVAVGLGAAGVDAAVAGAEPLDRVAEAQPRNSLPLSESTRSRRQPACLELARDAAGELAGLRGGGVVVGADDELGPGERGVDVDRGELPDRALGAAQASDVEAVDPDQLARPVDVDVLLGTGVARRLVGRGVAGDQPQPLGAGVQPVAAEHLPDAVGRDHDPAPLLARASSDATRRGPSPGCASEKLTIRSSTIFGSWLGICGRRRSRGPEHLQPVAVDLALPARNRSSGAPRTSDTRARPSCARRDRTAAGDSRTARHPVVMRLCSIHLAVKEPP